MLYRIDYIDLDDTPKYGYIEAVSPYWAQLQFNNDYDLEVIDVTEFKGILGENDVLL